MASSPVLDSAALLLPVPGDNPAGVPAPLTVKQKLESLRKEFEANPDNPSLAPIPKKPDWQKIRQLTEETLTRTSKDLELGFRLTEALAKIHGFAGLRDGLQLLVELLTQCWDRFHPIPEEGEGMEVRAERFYWITEADKGARFPSTIRALPLVLVKGEPASLHDQELAMHGQGSFAAADFDNAEPMTSDVGEDIDLCAAKVDELERTLTDKCGRDAPALTGLRDALESCRRFVAKVTPQPREQRDEPTPKGSERNGADGQLRPKVATSRDEAYRQLGQIADVLEQLEPHSPIPYLLRRAIELGKMPFRQLLHELVRDPSMLAEVRREFGIKEPEAPS